MIFDVINGMTRFSIMFHTANILKSSPKGEGFLPFPEGDNKNEVPFCFKDLPIKKYAFAVLRHNLEKITSDFFKKCR